jgi:predicted dehydrogenase
MNHLTRRTFLATTTAAAAASLATHRASRAAAASDTVTIAIMGVNNRGSQLLASLVKLPGINIAYVCDCDEHALAKGMKVAASAGNRSPKAVKDFRQALDDKSVDALFCCAPNHWHAPATILACAAGRHVYSEKPCSHTPAEGERMIAAANESKRAVQIGLQRRSNPHYVEAIAKLRDGIIGKLLYASSTYNNNRPSIGHGKQTDPPEWLDYDLWQGPAIAEAYRDNIIPYTWHNFWRWGNAEIGNNGVHTMDYTRWALEVDYPTRVTCAGSKLRYDDDQETPDTCSVIWEFPGHTMSWEGNSWSPPVTNDGGIAIEVRGEGGTLTIDDTGYKIYDLKRKVLAENKGHRSEIEHLGNFFDTIRGKAKLNCPVEEGHKSTLLAHLGNIAYRTGQTLETDPKTGHIKNNPAAEALWSCEYRDGWFPKA